MTETPLQPSYSYDIQVKNLVTRLQEILNSTQTDFELLEEILSLMQE